jgi:hypothetical protein
LAHAPPVPRAPLCAALTANETADAQQLVAGAVADANQRALEDAATFGDGNYTGGWGWRLEGYKEQRERHAVCLSASPPTGVI